MLKEYDAIYLSPHLDDAALSCGGQIFAKTTAGKSVLIATVMAGDPSPLPESDFARSLHERWNLVTDTVSRRRSEDSLACQILGADHLHWDVADCIYRHHPDTGKPLYASTEALFGNVHSTESSLINELSKRIVSLPMCAQLFAPLTVGRHVDHQITRSAAEASQRRGLFYYEDYPYVREPGALVAVVPAAGEWRSHTIKLCDADLRAKVASIAAFASQLTSFFADREDMARQIEAHAALTGGERIWSRLPQRQIN